MKKEFDLVTNRLMVDYNLQANYGSDAEAFIEEIFEVYLEQHRKEFERVGSGKKLHQIVVNILANLLNAQSQGFASLVYPLGSRNFKKSRYLPKFFSVRLVKNAVQLLVDSGVITKNVGTKRVIQVRATYGGSETSLVQEAATLKFKKEIEYPVDHWSDFGVRPDTEVIILKSKRLSPTSSSELVDYTDTTNMGKQIKEFIRPQVKRMNEYLLDHSVTYSGDFLCNRTHNSYHRIFNQSTIARGGRYFGHWGQGIPAKERHLMLIDGQPVMDVDYQAMYYSLLMYVDGSDCGPVGDPFHIPGYESYRGTFKKIAYALLNSSTTLNNAPNNLMSKDSKISYKELRSILLMNLPLLKKYLKSEIGMELMNLESKIIGEAIDYMMTFKYGFVIMHDGLLVAQNARSAQQCLEQSFQEITGWMPVVTTINH